MLSCKAELLFIVKSNLNLFCPLLTSFHFYFSLLLLTSDDVLYFSAHFGLVVGKSEVQMGEWKPGNTLAMKI